MGFLNGVLYTDFDLFGLNEECWDRNIAKFKINTHLWKAFSFFEEDLNNENIDRREKNQN
jgi:hypothetical protein